jgi:hypothetical protein
LRGGAGGGRCPAFEEGDNCCLMTAGRWVTGVGAAAAGVDWPGSGRAVGLGLDTALGFYKCKIR